MITRVFEAVRQEDKVSLPLIRVEIGVIQEDDKWKIYVGTNPVKNAEILVKDVLDIEALTEEIHSDICTTLGFAGEVTEASSRIINQNLGSIILDGIMEAAHEKDM